MKTHIRGLLGGLLSLVLIVTLAYAQERGVSRDGWLRVEWEVRAASQGPPVIAGYVYNDYILWVQKVRLRVVLLDAAGRSAGETVVPVFREIGPGSRGYFEAPLPGAAVTHRVTVDSFDVWFGRN